MARNAWQRQADSVVSLIDARMSESILAITRPMPKGLCNYKGKNRLLRQTPWLAKLFQICKSHRRRHRWKEYEPLAEIAAQSSDVLYPKALHMLPMAKQQIAEGNIFKASEIEPTYSR